MATSDSEKQARLNTVIVVVFVTLTTVLVVAQLVINVLEAGA